MSGGGGGPNFPPEEVQLAEPISYYRQQTGFYPSNSQVWWAYKRPRRLGSHKAPRNYHEVFDPDMRHQMAEGNSRVAKGHYILNAFAQDRSGVSGIEGLDFVTTRKRPSSIAFFAGRVFYAGVEELGFHDKIYFSQILEDPSQAAFCYQQLDPTSEDLRDLLPSDGGVISIPATQKIVSIKPLQQSLLVFTTNGLWQITGSQGIGFRANDYTVSKIAPLSTSSVLSFVETDKGLIWWADEGIMLYQTDQLGQSSLQNLTESTIQSIFDKIPYQNRVFAKGCFNHDARCVKWLFRSTVADTLNERFQYDKILALNLQTGAFWVETPDPASTLNGVFLRKGNSAGQETLLDVFVEDEPVFVDTETVEILQIETEEAEPKFYYTVLPSQTFSTYTFATEYEDKYVDWETLKSNTDSFLSTFTSGYSVLGEGHRIFQNNYVTVNYEGLPNTGAFVQGVWDYAKSSVTGEWGPKERLSTNAHTNHAHVSRKLKIRGSGKAVQLKITSDAEKPFRINGWSVSASSNGQV